MPSGALPAGLARGIDAPGWAGGGESPSTSIGAGVGAAENGLIKSVLKRVNARD